MSVVEVAPQRRKRILVVGTVPPPGGERALALAHEAERLADEGHEVQVLSPDVRAAAHHHARLEGLQLVFRIAAASRRYDALVLRMERYLPFRPDNRKSGRAVILAGLAWAIRGFSEVTIWLDSPIPIPWGIGGRTIVELWAKADKIVVENEEDRLNLLATPRVDPAKVSLAPIVEPPLPAPAELWPSGGEADPRADALLVVRRRADVVRRLDRAGARLATGTEGSTLLLEAAAEGATEQDVTELLLSEGDVTLEPSALLRLVIRRSRTPVRRLVAAPVRRALAPLRRLRDRAMRPLRPFDR